MINYDFIIKYICSLQGLPLLKACSLISIIVVCQTLAIELRAEEDTVVRESDCGIDSLYVLLRLMGKDVDLASLKASFASGRPQGHSMTEIQEAAQRCGVTLVGLRVGERNIPLDRPVIAFLRSKHEGHFLVVRPVGETGTMAQVLDFPNPPVVVDYGKLLKNASWTGKVLAPKSVSDTNQIFKIACLFVGLFVVGVPTVGSIGFLLIKYLKNHVLDRKPSASIPREL